MDAGGSSSGAPDADPTPQPPPRSGEGEKAPGLGVAEVFLEGPHHETKFRNLPADVARDVVRAWRDRLQFWRNDGRLAFAQVFKNEGEAAGASVDHCHSQLIALPFVPPRVADELKLASDPAGCTFCRWIASERAGPKFVFESDRFAVFCPSAPRFPGETWILPKAHSAAFETLTDTDATDLSNVLRNLLVGVADALAGPDFNLIVKSAPFRHDGTFHWRIEILPRLTSTAGWEWGTGLLINTMFPERAAELLRGAG